MIKRLLIVLGIVISLNANGQDSLTIGTGLRLYDSAGVTYGYIQWDQDTIPALLLVSDTSLPMSNVYYMKGYEILPKRWHQITYVNGDFKKDVPYKIAVFYLDEKKKPLPRSLVIWQSVFR